MKKADKLRLTSLWAKWFPELNVTHPLRACRRHGPLLVGLYLDELSDPQWYRPTLFFHNLSNPFPVIAFGLPGRIPLPGSVDGRVSVADLESASKSADLFRSEFPYLDRSTLTLNDFLGRARSYLHDEPWIGQRRPLEDVVFVAKWVGQVEYAERVANIFSEHVAAWPPSAMKGLPAPDWRDRVLTTSVDTLRENAAAETSRHGVESLPDLGIMVIESPVDVIERP